MKKNISRSNRKAFTLVELLVVILIISLIATVMAPRIFSGLGKAKRDIARAKITTIENAIAQFQITCDRLPDDSVNLQELLVQPEDLEGKWTKPFLKESEILDPWGNEYIYIAEGELNPGSFDIISYGADGEPGGEGDNEDIYND